MREWHPHISNQWVSFERNICTGICRKVKLRIIFLRSVTLVKSPWLLPLSFINYILAPAENEHCGIWSVLVISPDSEVQEDEISPITPITPCCIKVTAEYTASVMAVWPTALEGYESFSTKVMYAPGISCWSLISAAAIRMADIPLNENLWA